MILVFGAVYLVFDIWGVYLGGGEREVIWAMPKENIFNMRCSLTFTFFGRDHPKQDGDGGRNNGRRRNSEF